MLLSSQSLPPLLTPGNSWFVFYHHHFFFSRISLKESCITWSSVCLFLLNIMFLRFIYGVVSVVFRHLVVSDPFVTPWTVVHQAPLSVGFSRQGYWSGLPCPPPGVLPDPEIKPKSPATPALAGGFLTTSTTTCGVYCSLLICDWVVFCCTDKQQFLFTVSLANG